MPILTGERINRYTRIHLNTEDGEVTPTMKVKRKSISAQYEDIIEEMYKGGE